PLGKYALYLGIPGIRLHGTLAPASVGRRASHGCMRMLADDIEFLYNNVPLGTPVTITHNANKVGWEDHVLYLESEVSF
ncbi:L,D-transpeptidase, partial [Acinetobacter baumannii]